MVAFPPMILEDKYEERGRGDEANAFPIPLHFCKHPCCVKMRKRRVQRQSRSCFCYSVVASPSAEAGHGKMYSRRNQVVGMVERRPWPLGEPHHIDVDLYSRCFRERDTCRNLIHESLVLGFLPYGT